MKFLSKLVNYLTESIAYYGGDYKQLIENYRRNIIIFLSTTILVEIFFILLNFKGIVKLPIYLFLPFIVMLQLIIILYPLLSVWSNKEEFRKLLEKELPFFVMILYLNSLFDKGIIETLKEVSKKKLLKSIEREFMMIEKDMKLFNKSISKAIEKRALLHSSDNYGKFLSSYLSSLYVGTNMKQTLREELKNQLLYIHEKYKEYVNRSTELAELIFSIYLLVPLILFGFSFAFKINIVYLLLPMALTPAFLLLIGLQQPDMGYQINYNYKDIVVFASSFSILLVPFFNLTEKITIIVFINIISLIRKYIKIINDEKILNEIPLLLKEISEFTRVGYSIKNAILKIDLTRYSKPTQKLVSKIRKDVIVNGKLSRVNSSIWLIDSTFSILDMIDIIGGETYSVLTELSTILNNIINERKNLMNELKPYEFLAYVTPLLLWFTLTTFSGISVNSGAVPLLHVVLISYSVLTAIIFTKLSKFTIINVPLLSSVTALSLILSIIPLRLI